MFFYLVGLVDLIVRDITFSLKLVLSLLHILSGLGMYAFARVLCGSRQAGFAAALAYVLGVWHTQQIVIMGRLPLSVFYALLPWPFYFFEQLRFRSRQIPSTIGGSLTLGALPFVHPGYAFWATALLVFYIGVRFLAARSTWTLQNQGGYSLLIVLGGLVFGAYLVSTDRSLV